MRGTRRFAKDAKEDKKNLWHRNLEILADFSSKHLVDFPMPRNGRGFTGTAVDKYRMFSAFAKQHTTVLLEMADEVKTLHAAEISSGSRITSFP